MKLLSRLEIEEMRTSCRLAADTLIMVGKHIRPGMTTDDIDHLVHDYITSHDAYPSPLNYRGFPKSVCTSVNECVCHGIPSDYVLQEGDIINVDVTTYYPKNNGYHGDTSLTYYVGTPSEEAKLVVETARQSLEIGIAQVRAGAHLWDIGKAIQRYVETRGCSVVRDYVGHGIGREFHMFPQVPHYLPTKKRDRFFGEFTNIRLQEGMIFTIEPMVNLGTYTCDLQPDNWTVLTSDRKLSAQFEHTICVLTDGADVMTSRDEIVQASENVSWAILGPLSSPCSSAL